MMLLNNFVGCIVMEYRYKFNSEEEKEKIIRENSELHIIGYEILLDEGDFIVFSDVPGELPEPTEIQLLENKISILEAENADLLLDSASKDIKIQTIESDLADLTLEIAMGGM